MVWQRQAVRGERKLYSGKEKNLASGDPRLLVREVVMGPQTACPVSLVRGAFSCSIGQGFFFLSVLSGK